MIFEIAVGLAIVGTYIYHRYIEDHPSPPTPANIQLPQVGEGSPVPLIYGRCRIRQPILVWQGNNLIPDGGETRSTYALDMLLVIGIPFNGGRATFSFGGSGGIYAGDIRVGTLVGTSPGPQAFISNLGAPFPNNLSIVGIMYDGSPTQNVNDGAGDASGHSARSRMVASGIDVHFIPGYRGMMCVCGNFDIGADPQVPSLSFDCVSLSTGTASDLGHSLTSDADPAAVIYDLLTSPWGKLGIPTSKIDLTSFQAASLTLFNEGHGYSRAIERAEDAGTIIADILRQIDGLYYEEPTTGQVVLKLVRKDYDPEALDDINPNNAQPAGSAWYQVQGWSETINQVRVSFPDRIQAYSTATVTAQNMANYKIQQKLRPLELSFEGCTGPDLAKTIASRELAVVSQPSVKVRVIVNRSFYQKRPGDVVTLTWPELGVSKMIMRIVQVSLGQLHKGEIAIDMMRDIFDQTLGGFGYPDPP
jgi:hypothetical protein